MKADVYRQCKLRRAVADGFAVDTAWIPASLAKVGKTLKVKKDGDWEDGWVISETYAAMSFDELQIQRWAQKRWADVLCDGVGTDGGRGCVREA